MAELAVSLLIERLSNFIEQEVKLLKGVREEIELTKYDFEQMKAFLQRAESSQEDDPQLKASVNQVRDVAYDMEDILDEFMLKLARDHGHGFASCFRKIKSFIQNLKARHDISSATANIRKKVHEIGERHQQFQRQLCCTNQSASLSIRATSRHDLREDAFLIAEEELVGIDKPREKLINWLVHGEHGLEVVSIVGMGGSGKTTLAGRVYKNQQVKAYFQSHVWIYVSKSYKIEDILRDMIVQLYEEFQQPIPQGIEIMRSASLKQKVNGFLQEKNYVIVLDDVWNKAAIEGIKNALPHGSSRSRILITTRIAPIATALSNESKVYTCERLSSKDSWSLFCRKAFRGRPPTSRLEQQSLSQKILKKCEGLPLAIVAIGGLLCGKDFQEWGMIFRKLVEELESNDMTLNFKKIFSLSYNDLHYNLKCCFMYLGVFPEDRVIECMRLIRLWIAEGFVEKGEEMTQEEVAQGYLKELINRNLVEIVETTLDGRIKSCRVHDLMRESILSELKDTKLISLASEQRVELHGTVRRLSIQYNCDEVLKQLNIPILHSLLIFELATSSSSYEQFVPSGCRLLRVLDLGDSTLHEFPQQILVLFHLKYLSLRRTKVRIIPRSIGKLKNLETMDLKHTLVSELPVEIIKLKKLQYLFVYSYAKLTPSRPFRSVTAFIAPQGIGALASLQKLCYVKARCSRSKNTMQELGELCQLRRLGITDLKKDDAKELCHSLEKMAKLRSLEVIAESEDEVIDLDLPLSPPPLLRSLYIKGFLQTLPRWLCMLKNLAFVRLRWSRLKLCPLFALQNLPNLVELELTNAFDGEILVFGDGGFPKLKKLYLRDLGNLKFMSMDGQVMPCLQSLSINRCRLFDWQSLLDVIPRLANLKILLFWEMPEEFALAFYPYSNSRMWEGNLQEYYEEVMKRIPEVYFIWWEKDCWVRYDLRFPSYYAIKRRVMNCGEVLFEVL